MNGLVRLRRLCIWHAIFSILVGIAFYVIYSPQILVIQYLCQLTKLNITGLAPPTSNLIFAFIRNHGLDMLWAYALVFSVFLFCNQNGHGLRKAFCLAMTFACCMECLQLLPTVSGTFDPLDILWEIVSQLIAVLMIATRRKHYEIN